MSGKPYSVQSHHFTRTEQLFVSSTAEPGKHFVCDVADCRAKPFKRRGDLRRHSKKHNAQHVYGCYAVHCDRTGKKGFVRRDKLVDHMLAGHDEHGLFSCLVCETELPRDLFAVHDQEILSLSDTLNSYRTCPLRCSFKVKVPQWSSWSGVELKKIDELQHHLLKKHDLEERRHNTNLLEQRGYDSRTCDIICPLCPSALRLPGHVEFSKHFMQAHFLGPSCGEHDSDRSCSEECSYRTLNWRLKKWISVPDHVRQHRCAILRVWPIFRHCSVWEYIKCPGTGA
jgi:hypothetical protein